MDNNRHQYNMGIIGNCSFMAHIDDTANVLWMCWPRFDSPFVFGGLLDKDKGGEFSVRPEGDQFTSRQYYIDNTNVLCTEFVAPDGSFKVIDWAPRFVQYERYFKPLMLFRKIEVISGTPRVKVKCRPVGDYGKFTPEATIGSNHIRYSGLKERLRLTSNISLSYIKEEKSFTLNEEKYLALCWGLPLEAPLESTAEEFLRKTIGYWQNWLLHTSIGNFDQECVIRSSLALKLHQYDDTGAIIASGTTSLPEFNGSGRNWDYRYCWMRDAFYTLTALTNISQSKELDRYAEYMQNIANAEKGRYQPLYTITGGKDIKEESIDLKGYLGNQPVRIGNQAATHVQNDVYGQVLVSLLPLYVDRRFAQMGMKKTKDLIFSLLTKIEETMDEPDAGLWEFRKSAQKHCYTFLFHWAGSSAALKIAESLNDSKMKSMAIKLRDEAASQIELCYNPKLKVYTQAIGSNNLDASLLQLITMNYLDPKSEKAALHLKKLEEELKTNDALIYRYQHADDFGKPETTFLVCAYWYVEALACVGRLDEAIKCFEGLSKYSNHLGLMSEDICPRDGSQWGNFPQTYSHVGLVNAAFRITKKLDRPNFL